MISFDSIKLVIWDLDETFWSGTLSEGGMRILDDNVQLIKDLTDCGVINSICSKNDLEPTKKALQEMGVWDLFVFPSINWEGKGPQIKEKLDKMALRPVNVLFLDDNPSNLGEAKHYLPEIQTAGPEILPELIGWAKLKEKKDTAHKRLHQYKILEEKDQASKSFASSEDFLYDSQIQVEVHQDCLNQIQRIHELLTVKDRYGDYGIVGFYAKKGDRLEHFLFSCRTMGQKIEQWVYAQLGFPELEVVGEVRTELNKTECPGWINQPVTTAANDFLETKGTVTCHILMKGPCDLSHSVVYIKGSDQIDTEFTYVREDNGQIINAHNPGLDFYKNKGMQKVRDTGLDMGDFFINEEVYSLELN